LRKIVKQVGYGIQMGEPVAIDNSIYIPHSDEERFMSIEEKKQRETERKQEEDQAFNDAVMHEVHKILAESEEETERKRAAVLEEARSYAKAITADTKDTVAAMLDKTIKECELMTEQAKKDGYAEGYKKGFSESMEKCKKIYRQHSHDDE